MPISATTRPFGMGPIDDPGALGWDALGQGVHFSLGNGAAGSLLGDYPLATRNTMLHSTDSLAGFDAASTAEQAKKNAAAASSADAYMQSLMSGQASPGDETRMMAAMNPWEKAAWTGQGDPGNFIRKGNTIVPRYSEAQLAANPGLVSGHGTTGPSLASRLGISGQGTAVGAAPSVVAASPSLQPATAPVYAPEAAAASNAGTAIAAPSSALSWAPQQGPTTPAAKTARALPAQRMNVMPWDTPNLGSIYGLGNRSLSKTR